VRTWFNENSIKHNFNLNIKIEVLSGQDYNEYPLTEKQLEYLRSNQFKNDVEKYFKDRIKQFSIMEIPSETRFCGTVEYYTSAQ